MFGILWLASCGAGEDPERARALLVVTPGATDLKSTQAGVSYRVADRYPASATIESLGDALANHQCTVAERDPFNPEPGLPFNRWTEYTPDEGGARRLVWSGAWTCPPDGDVVIFGFQTTREGTIEPSTSLEVKGAYYSSRQLRAIRKQIGAGGGTSGSLFSGGRSTRQQTSYQTCSVCESTRKRVDGGPWKILYENATSPAHEHQWSDGVSTGTPVSDGRVVLVRRRTKLDDPFFVYGAFILESERSDPKARTDYRWILRTDGSSVLDPTNASASQGSAKEQGRVTFGPFSIPWSGGATGNGFLYYPRFPGSGRSSDDWELCITELSSFTKIDDAANPRFVYKTSPAD